MSATITTAFRVGQTVRAISRFIDYYGASIPTRTRCTIKHFQVHVGPAKQDEWYAVDCGEKGYFGSVPARFFKAVES